MLSKAFVEVPSAAHRCSGARLASLPGPVPASYVPSRIPFSPVAVMLFASCIRVWFGVCRLPRLSVLTDFQVSCSNFVSDLFFP